MAARQTAVAVLAVLLIAAAAVAETSWDAGNSQWATCPNQGNRIVKNSANLHLVYDNQLNGTSLKYTCSTNSGTNWITPEVVDLGTNYGDWLGCVAVDGNNKPWIVSATFAGGSSYALDGAVRRGTSDYNHSDARLGLTAGGFHSTSSVMSPSGGSDPMVYSLAAVTQGDASLLCFVAWDTSGGTPGDQDIATVVTTSYEEGYDVRGSIAAAGYSGNDTLHVVYQCKQDDTSRIYYTKSTNQVNPTQLRSTGSPSWDDEVEVSTSSSRPATNPTIELDGDTLYVAWRGPNGSGSWPGDIWMAKKKVIGGSWSTPVNVTATSSTESDFPTLSTRYGIAWHEFVSGSNYDIKALLDGNLVTIKSTANASKYPHIAVLHSADPYYVDCHTTWTEYAGVGSYYVYYKLYRYIPSDDGPDGGEGSGWVRIEPGQSLVTATPNPTISLSQISYYVQHGGTSRLELLDVQGRIVRTLASGHAPDGWNRATWDGRNDAGRLVPRGTYYCRLTTSSSVATDLLTVTR